ncbi:hypothetical protein BFG48_017210 [Acinetobacter nosocomialis]|uniref:Uncharacterized protein n=1 Tax=Acinetobacter nosocomialis TaxID=106654 RepID=A0AB36M1I9_ACINO|nr:MULTISPECIES: hypothetical protein [Acinetobacter calcoaceticus/baumannii complex]MDI9745593.1 hypothetical protein [Acinetobacter nosocomialis]MQZ37359.1 hypothetical protein [Acinetobacter nosocomialis]MRA10909.1 hypothetical protein [Acinetobacter nosocomialis]OTL97355.1 hypothetical protein B9X58_10875 [Acinetobacter nosocomialis]OUJ84017.1 hypothetical protein BFG48_017210 [Acinetobacter nosocomialis]
MCKANSFLMGVLPDIYRIMVAERKKVDRLVITQTSTPEGVPLPSYRYGRERVVHHTRLFLRRNDSDAGVIIQPVKAGWQCGQQAKDKLDIYCSQAHKMTFALI